MPVYMSKRTKLISKLEKSLTKWARKHVPEIYNDDRKMRAFLLCLRQLLKLTTYGC